MIAVKIIWSLEDETSKKAQLLAVSGFSGIYLLCGRAGL
jgi:hypothetical protein